MSRCCSFSIVACALHMTPLAAQFSSTGRSLALHYRPRVTNASCTSPIQKVGISATVSSGGYITFVDYCMSRCCSFSIVACALHMTPLAAQVSSTGRSLALHYRPRVTNASCTSPIQKVGISATVSSGGYITFVDYCIQYTSAQFHFKISGNIIVISSSLISLLFRLQLSTRIINCSTRSTFHLYRFFQIL